MMTKTELRDRFVKSVINTCHWVHGTCEGCGKDDTSVADLREIYLCFVCVVKMAREEFHANFHYRAVPPRIVRGSS